MSEKAANRSLSEKLEVKLGNPILKRNRFMFDPGYALWNGKFVSYLF